MELKHDIALMGEYLQQGRDATPSESYIPSV